VWRIAADFPRPGATIVDLAVVTTLGKPGLLAAGHIQSGTALCPHRTTAAMWESDDGLKWDEMLVDTASNSAISALAYPALAMGLTGAPGCPGAGVREWGPTDKADWYGNDAAGFEPGDVVVDALYVEVDSRVVATGWTADGSAGVWLTKPSYFTGRWVAVGAKPRSAANPLVALAGAERTVVGWDRSSAAPAWHPADGGNSWSQAEFQSPYLFEATDAIHAQERFFAAGSVCCALPTVRAGAVLSSSDGVSWSALTSEVLHSPPEAIVATSFGLVALGARTYVSSDGIRWTLGPALPGYDGGRLFAAIQGDTILIASPIRAWVASAADLRPEDWPSAPRSADLPEVGTTYSYRLGTQCGPHAAPIHFDLRTWEPDEASLPDGEWPRSFYDSVEWGQVRFTDQNLLEFTTTRGATVRYVPADNPPESLPCPLR